MTILPCGQRSGIPCRFVCHRTFQYNTVWTINTPFCELYLCELNVALPSLILLHTPVVEYITHGVEYITHGDVLSTGWRPVNPHGYTSRRNFHNNMMLNDSHTVFDNWAPERVTRCFPCAILSGSIFLCYPPPAWHQLYVVGLFRAGVLMISFRTTLTSHSCCEFSTHWNPV